MKNKEKLHDDIDIKNLCRRVITMSMRYSLSAQERADLEHLWAEFEDRLLDEELEEIIHEKR